MSKRKGKFPVRQGICPKPLRFGANTEPTKFSPIMNAVEEPLKLFDRDCQEIDVVAE